MSQEIQDEALIQSAFQRLLDTYLASPHRKKTEIITKAFNFAKAAHRGVRRRSGEPYILHPIAVAQICCEEMGMGSTTICAALLHDVVEDTDYTRDDIANLFGEKIANIVEGVTKVSGGLLGNRASMQAETFKKILLTMSDDIRVILVKIADRLHNMRTLSSMLPSRQYKIVGETLYIFAPLADRLGLNRIKTELEDLSFKYEHPDDYNAVMQHLKDSQLERDDAINDFTPAIRAALDARGIDYELKARIKSPYSIWQKMQRKHVPFEEVFDILAIRIIFHPKERDNEIAECYAIYAALTQIYKPHPSRFRDWLSTPKANGYQALHNTFMSHQGKWIEVQIRSDRMDDIAEGGFAAHWKYKSPETEVEERELDTWVNSIKEILDDPQPDTLDLLDTIKLNLFASELNVFTPKGDILTLPQGATVLDFAFATAGEDYVQRAADRGWLLQSDSITTPATFAQTEDFQLRAQIEPARDFRISLTFSRNHNRNKTIQYMFEGMPSLQSGSFAMTTLSLGSAFSSNGTADNGYRSARFQQFLGALDRYQARLQQRYVGTTYPAGLGSWSGQPYNPENGVVGKYSSEVMIPAFLDTYTSMGGTTNIFPILTKLLPNWTLTYSGLASLPAFKRWFRAFNLNHSYRSLYNVGSYNSFQSYRSAVDGLGFISNVENGRPQPSSQFDISTVSINESFSPLLGVDATFYNSMTAKLEMRRTRVLTLSMASQLLTETHSNDIVVGFGYRVNDFKFPTFGGSGVKGKSSKSRRSARSASANNSNNDSFSDSASGTSGDGFAHSLNLRLDLSFRDQSALQRNLLTTLSQATSGNRAVQISFSADYAVSRFFTISAYYERQMNRPLLTSSAFPTMVQDFGLNLKFQLAR